MHEVEDVGRMSIISPKTIVITTIPKPTLTSCGGGDRVQHPDPSIIMESGPRKRRRLTNLSPDERLMRRKLKNRVAAQTARDRKKARMCELEETLAELEEENRRLQTENLQLKQRTGDLATENSALKDRLNVPSSDVVTERECKSTCESAAGKDVHPLSLDDALRSISPDTEADLLSLLQQITNPEQEALTCTTTQPQGGNTSQPTAEVVGPTATELESFKELIEFDHVYFKSSSQPAASNMKTEEPSASTRSFVSPTLKPRKAVSLLNTTTNCSTQVMSPKLAESYDVSDVDFTSLSERLEDLDDFEQLCSSVSAVSEVVPPAPDKCDLKEEPLEKHQLFELESLSSFVDSEFHSSPELPSLSDAGYSSDNSVSSPKSDLSSTLGDDLWEESFSELFPALL